MATFTFNIALGKVAYYASRPAPSSSNPPSRPALNAPSRSPPSASASWWPPRAAP
jgi:hypothetical protein